MPEGVDPKDGVSWSTVGLTALALAKESYPVKKGDWVLIRAAAGGVGLVLTQIVKYLGGHVIGTVSSQDKAELVKSYGADLVLLSTDPSEDNVKKILEVTNGGVHGVYDGVGKDTWEEDFLVVRRKGTIVTFGNASVSVFFFFFWYKKGQADMAFGKRVPSPHLLLLNLHPKPSRSPDPPSGPSSLPLKNSRSTPPSWSISSRKPVSRCVFF